MRIYMKPTGRRTFDLFCTFLWDQICQRIRVGLLFKRWDYKRLKFVAITTKLWGPVPIHVLVTLGRRQPMAYRRTFRKFFGIEEDNKLTSLFFAGVIDMSHWHNCLFPHIWLTPVIRWRVFRGTTIMDSFGRPRNSLTQVVSSSCSAPDPWAA